MNGTKTDMPNTLFIHSVSTVSIGIRSLFSFGVSVLEFFLLMATSVNYSDAKMCGHENPENVKYWIYRSCIIA